MYPDQLRVRIQLTRSGEFLCFQAFEPQTEPVSMPVQHLEFIALAIDEHV